MENSKIIHLEDLDKQIESELEPIIPKGYGIKFPRDIPLEERKRRSEEFWKKEDEKNNILRCDFFNKKYENIETEERDLSIKLSNNIKKFTSTSDISDFNVDNNLFLNEINESIINIINKRNTKKIILNKVNKIGCKLKALEPSTIEE